MFKQQLHSSSNPVPATIHTALRYPTAVYAAGIRVNPLSLIFHTFPCFYHIPKKNSAHQMAGAASSKQKRWH